MYRSLFVLALVSGLFSTTGNSLGQSPVPQKEDARDTYLRGYLMMTEGYKLGHQKDYIHEDLAGWVEGLNALDAVRLDDTTGSSAEKTPPVR